MNGKGFDLPGLEGADCDGGDARRFCLITLSEALAGVVDDEIRGAVVQYPFEFGSGISIIRNLHGVGSFPCSV